MKTLMLIGLFLAIAGCATDETDHRERVYAPQTVTGWKDQNGNIHLKGEGGEDGHAVISASGVPAKPLGWGGAAR